MSPLVLLDQPQPGVTVLSLNRPQRRNALCIALLDELVDALKRLQEDPSQRVVILRGEGPVFSAGLDLKEAADSSLVERSAGCVEQALSALRDSPLVSIAAVHGGAFAGGAGLMAACDIVIAAEDAQIGFPEARRGLLPALICDVLVQRVCEGDLRDLFLAGDPVGSSRAQHMGLVQRVVPADMLYSEALKVARSVLAGGPQTVRATKALLNSAYGKRWAHTSESLQEIHLAARHSDEAREGLTAFLEKRDPHWMKSPS